jgi:hypothetical protein
MSKCNKYKVFQNNIVYGLVVGIVECLDRKK